jgi:predicted RecB family nuclease
VELFLDFEGIPDQQFSYLIGLLVRGHGSLTHHSYWADSLEDEESIWNLFVQKAGEYPDAPIYHYGSYEARVSEQLAKRFGTKSESIAKRAGK